MTPSGTVTVVGVAPEPNYTCDPDRVSFDCGDARVVVPAGPNDPVGTVLPIFDLSRDTYGIHGAPDPPKVGKTASNDCVRLTYWDAEQLAAGEKPGVAVRFIWEVPKRNFPERRPASRGAAPHTVRPHHTLASRSVVRPCSAVGRPGSDRPAACRPGCG
jgi:hypothetical protein